MSTSATTPACAGPGLPLGDSSGGPDPDRLYAACDLYGYEHLLSAAERSVLAGLREVLERDVRPLVADHWDRAEFPVAAAAAIEGLGLITPTALDGEPSWLYKGFRIFELARTDVSTAVWFGIHATLFRHSILLGGSPEQVADLDPRVRSYAVRGAFALTEPDHGSDVAQHLATRARRVGETWILDGAKRWIGGAEHADLITVMARDESDGQVKAFLVDRHSPGMTVERITRKMSLRMVSNADIRLDGVRVAESMRLQRVDSFADVNRMLRSMRADVTWMACGAQAGAYEAALRYARERRQFGRPVASFQLVQDKLVTMLGNLTASLSMAVRIVQLADTADGLRDEQAALAKAWIARRTRETVALARELGGGDGIVVDGDVGRFFADVESIYTFEGTDEINQLVVGRAITGTSAITR